MRDVPRHTLHLKDFGTLAFYWRTVVRPYPKQTTTILLLMFGGALLDAMTVGLILPLFDVLTATERVPHNAILAVVTSTLQAVGMSPSMNAVIFAMMVIASLLFLLRSAFVLLNQSYTAAIAVKLRRTMKTSLFGRFVNAQYEEISKRARGTVIHDINQPAESLAGAITQLGIFLTGVFNSALMVGLLLYFSWWATVLIGTLAICSVQGWRRYADSRSAAYGGTLYGLRGEQNKLQVDAIDGLKVVKAHGLERQMVERQDALLAAELRPELKLVRFRNGPALVNELLAVAIMLGLGAITFLFPSMGIRFSILAAFLLAIRRIVPSIASVNMASVELNRFKRNLEVIEEVLGRLPQEKRGGQTIGRAEEIRLTDVSFAYASRFNHTVLEAITATMRRGTVTAIVGPTGSGKSTIANLLLGLYAPQSGTIAINGVDLQQMDVLAWRTHVGYVSQDVFVFNATIRDNIALGDEGVSVSQIEWAARVAQLHDFVASLPHGYATVVGDRGVRLSGGQCQRLAITRAILRRPEMLIFDEATSALDNLTERAVYDAISTLHHDAIIIVIAHRLSTVRDADQILVLQSGRIVEVGTHDVLMSQRRSYAKLYKEDGQRAMPSPGAAGLAGTSHEPQVPTAVALEQDRERE